MRVGEIKLFAGLDAFGEMRFIGEVERGANCGCFCPECSSPLVAKQGDLLEWHFAHVAGQEAPQCEAGAVNLLRRLVLEYLQEKGLPDLPPYRQRVSAASRLREVSEVVEWSAEVSPGSIAWVDKPSRTEAVGRCRLDNGADVQVFVEISAPSTSRPSFPAGEAGILVFWVPLPESSQLRQRSQALEHVRHQGRLYWYHQPDVRGLVAAAQSRVNSVARDDEERLARDAGRRWKAVHDRLVQSGAQDESEPHGGLSAQRDAKLQEAEYDWAPGRKPHSSFIFYRLREGSAWVIYQRSDGSHWLTQRPEPEEGWDECFPPSLGVPDQASKSYRLGSVVQVMEFLGRHAAIVRTDSDPAEFDGL